MSRIIRNTSVAALQASAVAAFLLGAEVAFRAKLLNPLLFASPSQILEYALTNGGSFATSLIITFRDTAIGFAIAAVAGIALGLLLGISYYYRDLLLPIVFNLYSLPKVVLLPVFLVALGLGENSSVWFGAFHGVFPVIVSTLAGIRSLKSSYTTTAISMGAKGSQIYRHVLLPGILPYILSGFRLAVIFTVTGVITAEAYASNSGAAGIGSALISYADNFNTPALYSAVAVVGLIVVSVIEILTYLEKRASRN